MKYEINKELLPEYYDALINFKDWIPSVIQFELPTEISLAVGGDNNALQFDNQFNHSREKQIKFSDEDLSWEEVSDWECEIFLRKYPYFTPLFIIDEDYVYVPPTPNKHQSTINPISKLLRKIFSI